MRCGNVREIFVFMQRAFRGRREDGQRGGGRQGEPAGVRRPQTRQPSLFTWKRESLSNAGRIWQLLPNPGEAHCKDDVHLALAHGSPPRGDSTRPNGSHPPSAALGEKAMPVLRAASVPEESQDSSGATVSPAQRKGRGMSCPEKQGISTPRWPAPAAAPPRLALDPSPAASCREQGTSLHKAAGRHFCFTHTRLVLLKLTFTNLAVRRGKKKEKKKPTKTPKTTPKNPTQTTTSPATQQHPKNPSKPQTPKTAEVSIWGGGDGGWTHVP